LNVVGGMNMVADEPTLSFSDDSHGHGTHVAGRRKAQATDSLKGSNRAAARLSSTVLRQDVSGTETSHVQDCSAPVVNCCLPH
jgi:hypothetical protein